jgi:hypothetical protein
MLNIACDLLKITAPWKKDDRGYNRVDAWLFKYMLEKSVTEFSVHNLEWVRRKLLNYKRQITELGLDYAVLQRVVSDKAVYGSKVLEQSKFLGMELQVKRDTRFTFKWRVFKDHHTEKVQVIMERSEGVKFLTEQGFFHCTEDAEGITEMKVTYPPQEFVSKLADKFGLPLK